MTPDDLHTSLGEHIAHLPGSIAVRTARQSALAHFMGHGFPSRKMENWRYTNVAPIVDGQFDLFPATPSADEQTIRALLADAEVASDDAAILFLDGALVADRADRLREGAACELLPLAETLERHGAPLQTAIFQGYPFAALNAAFARDGMHLHVARDATLPSPLHVILANAAVGPHAVQPQIIIELAPGASATVVVHLLSAAGTANWVNLVTRVVLAQGAQLEMRRIQRYGAATLHTELLSASIGKDALLRSTSVDIGGQLVRNDVHARMEGHGASCDLAGLVAASEQQLMDNHIVVDHVASRSSSLQAYRAIVGDRGRAVFNGKVIVNRDTVGISAMQSSDNLLLDESGEVDTKPELEIYADDVKCSHGATIGEIDESELFYLRARGIDERTARGLLTLGFAERTLERVQRSSARAAIAAKFGLSVPRDEAWQPET